MLIVLFLPAIKKCFFSNKFGAPEGDLGRLRVTTKPKILPTRDTEVSYLVHLMDSMIAGKGGKELAAIAKKLLLEISKRSPVEASGHPINVEDEDVLVEDAQVIQEQEPLDIEVKDDKVELVVK